MSPSSATLSPGSWTASRARSGNGGDDDPTADLAAFIYDALYEYNDRIEPVPNLGECEPSADELVWTCALVEATFTTASR